MPVERRSASYPQNRSDRPALKTLPATMLRAIEAPRHHLNRDGRFTAPPVKRCSNSSKPFRAGPLRALADVEWPEAAWREVRNRSRHHPPRRTAAAVSRPYQQPGRQTVSPGSCTATRPRCHAHRRPAVIRGDAKRRPCHRRRLEPEPSAPPAPLLGPGSSSRAPRWCRAARSRHQPYRQAAASEASVSRRHAP